MHPEITLDSKYSNETKNRLKRDANGKTNILAELTADTASEFLTTLCLWEVSTTEIHQVKALIIEVLKFEPNLAHLQTHLANLAKSEHFLFYLQATGILLLKNSHLNSRKQDRLDMLDKLITTYKDAIPEDSYFNKLHLSEQKEVQSATNFNQDYYHHCMSLFAKVSQRYAALPAQVRLSDSKSKAIQKSEAPLTKAADVKNPSAMSDPKLLIKDKLEQLDHDYSQQLKRFKSSQYNEQIKRRYEHQVNDIIKESNLSNEVKNELYDVAKQSRTTKYRQINIFANSPTKTEKNLALLQHHNTTPRQYWSRPAEKNIFHPIQTLPKLTSNKGQPKPNRSVQNQTTVIEENRTPNWPIFPRRW